MAQRQDVRGQPANGQRRPFRRVGSQPRTASASRVKGGEEPVRPAAFIGQFAGDLLPAVAELAQQRVLRQQQVLDGHLIEMVLAAHVQNRAHRHAVAARLVQVTKNWLAPAWRSSSNFASVRQNRDHVIGPVCVGGPHLRAVHHPAACARTARVRAAARSDPESGSLMPMQKEHSPARCAAGWPRAAPSVP